MYAPCKKKSSPYTTSVLCNVIAVCEYYMCINVHLFLSFAADLKFVTEMATVRALKESLVMTLVTLWKQWTKNKERLQESRRVVRSQNRGNVLLKDGGLMGASAGRGKKKEEAIDSVLRAMAVPLEEAMLMRDNILF